MKTNKKTLPKVGRAKHAGIIVTRLVEEKIIIKPIISLTITNVPSIIKTVQDNNAVSCELGIKAIFKNKIDYYRFLTNGDGEEIEDRYDSEDEEEESLFLSTENLLLYGYGKSVKTKPVEPEFLEFDGYKIDANELSSCIDCLEADPTFRKDGTVTVKAVINLSFSEQQLDMFVPFVRTLFPSQFVDLRLTEKRTWHKRRMTFYEINHLVEGLAKIGWEPTIKQNQLVFVCMSKESSKLSKKKMTEAVENVGLKIKAYLFD